MVCLHLWCLWKYWPEEGRMRESVHVMEACMMLGQALHLQDLHLYRQLLQIHLHSLIFESDSDGFMFISPPTWGRKRKWSVGYAVSLERRNGLLEFFYWIWNELDRTIFTGIKFSFPARFVSPFWIFGDAHIHHVHHSGCNWCVANVLLRTNHDKVMGQRCVHQQRSTFWVSY